MLAPERARPGSLEFLAAKIRLRIWTRLIRFCEAMHVDRLYLKVVVPNHPSNISAMSLLKVPLLLTLALSNHVALKQPNPMGGAPEDKRISVFSERIFVIIISTLWSVEVGASCILC